MSTEMASIDVEKKTELEPGEWRREGVHLYIPIFLIVFIFIDSFYLLCRFPNIKTVPLAISKTSLLFFFMSLIEQHMMLRRPVDRATRRTFRAVALLFGTGTITGSFCMIFLSSSPFEASVVPLWLMIVVGLSLSVAGLSIAGALYGHVIYGVEDVIFPWRRLKDLPLFVRMATWVFPVLCLSAYLSGVISYSLDKSIS
ncbi:hypothetical protein QJS10_CPA05g00833 [Acorus calamus]|uniref:Uncharacterized protein n=1 Tax=Acorus calamus TaxID=4465 RepID=A0AAV9ERP6_ACOCL|nr:hypothetical protein QJS10_CPA05g00833 [Acorus calamus]